jgi:hypothetical protein
MWSFFSPGLADDLADRSVLSTRLLPSVLDTGSRVEC